MTTEAKITTVEEMKKFLENFKGEDKIVFTNGDMAPCRPYTFKVMSVKNLTDKWLDCTDEALAEVKVKPTDVVIYASF